MTASAPVSSRSAVTAVSAKPSPPSGKTSVEAVANTSTTSRPVRLGGGGIGARQVERDRLLAKDVLSGAGGLADQGGVGVVRGGDDDGLDRGVGQQRPVGGRREGARRQRLAVVESHHAGADDANAHLFRHAHIIGRTAIMFHQAGAAAHALLYHTQRNGGLHGTWRRLRALAR